MKILLLKKPENAVSHYRGIGVFGPLSRQFPDVQIAYSEAKNITPDIAGCYDWVFSHRPGSDAEINAIYLCYRLGVRVWIDLDDLVWQIPAGNPVQGQYTQKIHTNLHHAMSMATLVTCSTKYLAEQTSQVFNVRAVVVPNAWNEHLFQPHGEPTQTPYEGRIRVLWRGSNTHDADLMHFVTAFKDRENVDFIFMGSNPWYLHKSHVGLLSEIQHIPWQPNTVAYVDALFDIRPHFVVVPLQDNPFNRAKSNIAELEAQAAGAIAIVPDWEEWKSRARYRDAEEHTACDHLTAILNNLKIHLDKYSPPHAERSLSVVNAMRYELLTNRL
jgi:hypothetical protein